MELVRKLKDMKVENPSHLGSTTLAVYDFAGQDKYAVFQQIFISSQALFLVVFRLDSMFSGETAQVNPSELRVVLCWLYTIHLRAPDAKVFLIGTQSDLIPSCNTSLLDSKIPDALKHQLVVSVENPASSRFVFVVSAKTGDGMESLHTAVDSSAQALISEVRPKPVGWIRLQDWIAEMIASDKCPVIISFDNLLELGRKDFRIVDAKELGAMLRYFHVIGVVLYFPKNNDLKDFVFLDPRAVVNIVAKVFRFNDEPPLFGKVSLDNRLALEKLINEKKWRRSPRRTMEPIS